MGDYSVTPSFFKNEKYFKNYLGQTSYYAASQNVVDKVVKLTGAKKVLELGAALGTTSLMLAKKHPETDFAGIDIRSDVVTRARRAAAGCENASFLVEDMCNTVKKPLDDYDLIFMLYTFHHIQDPLKDKVEFLRNCYANMKRGTHLLITETFLPEEIENIKEEQEILNLWRLRGEEGYASTFWSSLQELTEEGCKFAKESAKTSMTEEVKAGNSVYWRKGEYLVKFSWLQDTAKTIGFTTVIAEPINCLFEKAILLRK